MKCLKCEKDRKVFLVDVFNADRTKLIGRICAKCASKPPRYRKGVLVNMKKHKHDYSWMEVKK